MGIGENIFFYNWQSNAKESSPDRKGHLIREAGFGPDAFTTVSEHLSGVLANSNVNEDSVGFLCSECAHSFQWMQVIVLSKP